MYTFQIAKALIFMSSDGKSHNTNFPSKLLVDIHAVEVAIRILVTILSCKVESLSLDSVLSWPRSVLFLNNSLALVLFDDKQTAASPSALDFLSRLS